MTEYFLKTGYLLVHRFLKENRQECENRVLRRIFGLKMEKAMGSWRRLRNVELHKLYTSSNVIRVIKSSTMRWVDK